MSGRVAAMVFVGDEDTGMPIHVRVRVALATLVFYFRRCGGHQQWREEKRPAQRVAGEGVATTAAGHGPWAHMARR